MKIEILILGFGGQGVKKMGKIIAAAALAKNYNLVCYAAYGSAGKGDLSDTTVIISSDPIDAPVLLDVDYVINLCNKKLSEMDNYKNFEKLGVNFKNAKILSYVDVPDELKSKQVANTIMLGRLARILQDEISENIFIEAIKSSFQLNLHSMNTEAFRKGFNA